MSMRKRKHRALRRRLTIAHHMAMSALKKPMAMVRLMAAIFGEQTK